MGGEREENVSATKNKTMNKFLNRTKKYKKTSLLTERFENFC